MKTSEVQGRIYRNEYYAFLLHFPPFITYSYLPTSHRVTKASLISLFSHVIMILPESILQKR